MFIRRLRLISELNGTVLREVIFHSGVNTIVDSSSSQAHNKVGKTTFLKLIDVALGAKKKDLYFTSSTQSVVDSLRSFIEDEKVSVELTLARDLSKNVVTTAKVELFENGKRFIDGKSLNQTAYANRLKEVLFSFDGDQPTLRQLVPAFVRAGAEDSGSGFLKYLHGYQRNLDYRRIYNFLLGIGNDEILAQIEETTDSLNKSKNGLGSYRSLIGSIRGSAEEKQVLDALEAKAERLRTELDDIISASDFAENRDRLIGVRAKYLEMDYRLSDLKYRIERNGDSLDEARREAQRQPSSELTREFFDEVSLVLPTLSKTFDEMVEFNRRLCQNRISFLESVEEELSRQLTDVENDRDALLNENSKYLSLVVDDQIEQYEELSRELEQTQRKIGEKAIAIETIERYESNISRLEEKLGKLQREQVQKAAGDDYKDAMEEFNGFFTSYAKRINDEEPILVYNPQPNGFPLSIENLKGGVSTGTLKSLLAAYDLAYQSYAHKRHISGPRFVVHDVVENIEGAHLKSLFDIADSIGCQYIVAVLKEKLDSSDIPEDVQERSSIVHLSSEDRLFEGRLAPRTAHGAQAMSWGM